MLYVAENGNYDLLKYNNRTPPRLINKKFYFKKQYIINKLSFLIEFCLTNVEITAYNYAKIFSHFSYTIITSLFIKFV